jgi:tocopherol O-methyltransferase
MALENIITYYDETHGDYKRVWGTERNLSFHYGFFDAGIRGHDAAAAQANREVARRANVGPGSRVLDAGCGIGGNLIWMAENLKAEAVGINIQPMHIALGRGLAASRGVDHLVTFVQGDYTKMPFPDADFDAVIGVEAICHAEDKRAFVREAARVLRPGGRLIVVDFYLARTPQRRRERRMLDEFLRGWVMPHLAGVREFGEWMQEAGFRHVEFENTTSRVMPDARRMHHFGVLTAPLTRYREWSGRRSPEEALNRRAAITQYPLLRRGVWAHGIWAGEAGPRRASS